MSRILSASLLAAVLALPAWAGPAEARPELLRDRGITITCVATDSLERQYNSSVGGPDGDLADGDTYTACITFTDGVRRVQVPNDSLGFYVDRYGLDAQQAYTWELGKDPRTAAWRIDRIRDGDTVLFDRQNPKP